MSTYRCPGKKFQHLSATECGIATERRGDGARKRNAQRKDPRVEREADYPHVGEKGADNWGSSDRAKKGKDENEDRTLCPLDK